MRKPSHLLSKTQAGSSNGASVSVASMGCSRRGSLDSRGMVHTMAKPVGQPHAPATRPRRVQLRRAKGWRIVLLLESSEVPFNGRRDVTVPGLCTAWFAHVISSHVDHRAAV